jgi:hypothetical protein
MNGAPRHFSPQTATTMSDLDADLYGGLSSILRTFLCSLFFTDLYGNEEGDRTEQDQPPEKEAETEIAAPQDPSVSDPRKEQVPPNSKPLESTPIASTSQVLGDAATHKSYSVPQPVATYTSQPTQHIPTYQETPQEYPELPAPRGQDASYAGGLLERSVRPSEMKDEG